MIRAELHAHTHYSRGSIVTFDGVDPPSEIVKAAKLRGLDAIAITDHDTLQGLREAREAGRKHGVEVIPGLEISSEQGHILALGVEELIPAGLSAAETLDEIHDRGGVAVAPHPYDVLSCGVGSLINKLDFDRVEVHNSINLDGFGDWLARRVVRDRKKWIVGSDAHSCEMVGLATLQFDCNPCVDEILSCLRSNRCLPSHSEYATVGQLVRWNVRRLQLSYDQVHAYIDANYCGLKRRLSKFLLGLVKRSPGKVDKLFIALGYCGYFNVLCYSSLHSLLRFLKLRFDGFA